MRLRAAAAGLGALCAAASPAAAEDAPRALEIHAPAIGLFVHGPDDAPGGVLIDAMRLTLDAAGIEATFFAKPLLRLGVFGAPDPWSCIGPVPLKMLDGDDLRFTALLARVHVHAMALADRRIGRIRSPADLRFYRVVAPRATPDFDILKSRGVDVLGVADLDRGVDALIRGRAEMMVAPELAADVAAQARGVALKRVILVNVADVGLGCHAAMPEERRMRIAEAFKDGVVGPATTPLWLRAGVGPRQAEARRRLRDAQAALSTER